MGLHLATTVADSKGHVDASHRRAKAILNHDLRSSGHCHAGRRPLAIARGLANRLRHWHRYRHGWLSLVGAVVTAARRDEHDHRPNHCPSDELKHRFSLAEV